MDSSMKENNALGNLFSTIMSDLKNSSGVWEDIITKSNKLHAAIRMVVQSFAGFLESFQRIADQATNAQGSTKEIGVSLTRLCMRQRTLDAKLKALSQHLLVSLANPLQETLDEWKRRANQLDKDRVSEMKNAKTEWKRVRGEWTRLDKKVKKGKMAAGSGSLHHQEELARQEVAQKKRMMDETERNACRRAMIEERSRYCFFVNCLKPVLELQSSMLDEFVTIEELTTGLTNLSAEPNTLPTDSETFLRDLDGCTNESILQPSGGEHSTNSLGSRKSSMASICSANSNSSNGSNNSPAHHQLAHLKTNTLNSGTLRVSNLSSQDSSVSLQDQNTSQIPKSKEFMRLTASKSGYGHNRSVSNGDSASLKSSGNNSSNGNTDYMDPDCYPPPMDLEDANSNGGYGEGVLLAGATMADSNTDEEKLAGRDRHTISSSYERAGQANRPGINDMTFESLNMRAGSIDNGIEAPLLYPNQSIPGPGYTNITHLAHAAQRKYSISSASPRQQQMTPTNQPQQYCGQRRQTLPEVAKLSIDDAIVHEINDLDMALNGPVLNQIFEPHDPSHLSILLNSSPSSIIPYCSSHNNNNYHKGCIIDAENASNHFFPPPPAFLDDLPSLSTSPPFLLTPTNQSTPCCCASAGVLSGEIIYRNSHTGGADKYLSLLSQLSVEFYPHNNLVVLLISTNIIRE